MNKKPTSEILRIFPLTIYRAQIGLSEDERNELIKEVYDQKKKSKNLSYKDKTSAWTGDTQGFEFLYLNKRFAKLFGLISLSIRKYTEQIGINNDKIDFYYQRAWATISKNRENIKLHKHNQSHISFAYYLKKNKDDGNLNFHNGSMQNEIAPAIFLNQNDKQQDIYKNKYDNARIVTAFSEADELIIFPSKTAHSTTPNKSTDERISISADVSIIAKNSENIEHLLTPVDKWQKF